MVVLVPAIVSLVDTILLTEYPAKKKKKKKPIKQQQNFPTWKLVYLVLFVQSFSRKFIIATKAENVAGVAESQSIDAIIRSIMYVAATAEIRCMHRG